MNLEEACVEFLECARYGEVEDLRACLAFGVPVDFRDAGGNSAMHRAAANGEVECLRVLKEHGATYAPNTNGNTPLHWAVQNAKLEAAQFLVSNYDLDVLAKNAMGRSVLTDAFQAGNTDLIELCLSHPTSSEERLIAVDGAKVKAKPDGSVSISTDGGDGATEEGADGPSSSSPPVQSSVKDLEANAVTHRLAFREADLQDAAAHLVVRELPIDHADSPFGTDTAPELDTTGLGIWPASLLLARWVLDLAPLLEGRDVVELGCGCGVPGLAAAVAVEGRPVVGVARVNWQDPSSFPLPQADVVLGSDLVYDAGILKVLVPAVGALLRPGGYLLYSCPTTERDGMSELVAELAGVGIVLAEQGLVPDSYFENPLASRDGDEYVLHFYDMSARKPYLLFKFCKVV